MRVGVPAVTLLLAALLSGCTAQNEPEPEGEPTPATPSSAGTPVAADPVTGTYTGTTTFDLGPAPEGATTISITLTCLSPGTFSVERDRRLTCDDGVNEEAPGATTTWSLPLSAGQESTEVTTSDPDATYQVRIAYKTD